MMGALLISNEVMPDSKYQSNLNYVDMRLLADNLKRKYFLSEFKDKEYLEVYREAEKVLDDNLIYKMSEISLGILRSIDFDHIKRKRRRNYLYLKSKLDDIGYKTFPLGENTVPLTLPLFINDRDFIRKHLIEKKYIVQFIGQNQNLTI